jgi:hypothetical protein
LKRTATAGREFRESRELIRCGGRSTAKQPLKSELQAADHADCDVTIRDIRVIRGLLFVVCLFCLFFAAGG